MIPRLLHQTAATGELPASWRQFAERARELHPGWAYRLWTDADLLELVRRDFPGLLALYRNLPEGVMRADVGRYLILESVGGLYFDCDYEMLKPFDLLDRTLVLPLSRSRNFGDKRDRIGNAILASQPGHRFWKAVIEDLRRSKLWLRFAAAEHATGPYFLTRIFARETDWGEGVETPDRSYFHPPTPRSPRDHDRIVAEGVARGIHHCHGSGRRRRSGARRAVTWIASAASRLRR